MQDITFGSLTLHENICPFYFDTEFIETRSSVQLISIGIVSPDGRQYYAVDNSFDTDVAMNDGWLKANVLKPIYMTDHPNLDPEGLHPYNPDKPFTPANVRTRIQALGKDKAQIASEIVSFVGTHEPLFIGYYSAYDWVLLAKLFGKLMDLPWQHMYHLDIQQMLHEEGWSIEDPSSHNALDDAIWVKDVHQKIHEIRAQRKGNGL